MVEGLPAATPDTPRSAAARGSARRPRRLDGFLKSTGLGAEQLDKRDTGKGEFWFAIIAKKGRPTPRGGQEVVEAAMAALPWPKSMRWGAHAVRWVRPIQRILCLFAGAVVPVAFGPVVAGDTTAGHRFLAPERFAVKDFADYFARLENARVMFDPAQRRHAILAQAEAAAAAEGMSCATIPACSTR